MEIESIRHRGLKRFVMKGDRRIIEPDRLTDMIAYIDAAVGLDDLEAPPNFGFHALKGNQRGTYAMTVTKNWRLTFTKASDTSIADLNLEDYHGD